MEHRLTTITFSPGGSTENITNLFCTFAGWTVGEKVDLLQPGNNEKRIYQADEVVLIATPVFYGRMPAMVSHKLQEIKGTNTPAIALVVYGNRDYEDALLELTDIMTTNGFTVFGAAAFIARHSIFPQVAQNRPDEEDKMAICAFAKQCLTNIEMSAPQPLHIKGNRPYRPYATLPINPKGNASCTECGICARICPTQAIDAQAPKKTNKERCINCTACVYNCPIQARSYGGFLYKVGGAKFEKKCSEYKSPELFV